MGKERKTMMIIWGLGKVTHKFYGTVMSRQCSRCNNQSNWQLCVARTWFTLFFIPVIPYRKRYCIVCPHCKSYIEIDKERFDELLKAVQEGQTDAVKYAGKAPTQIEYLKAMEEEQRRNNGEEV